MPSTYARETSPNELVRPRFRTAADIAALEQLRPEEVIPFNTIYQCIVAAARIDPHKTALCHLVSADPDSTPRTVSYAQLQDQIERAANLFRSISIGEQRSSVSIILPMLPEALMACWGGATAGIANPINPYLEIGQIASIMNASRATVLVTTTARYGSGAWNRCDEIRKLVPTLRRILIVDSDNSEDDFAAAVAACPQVLQFKLATARHDEAVYLPTGGTTAAPKLVRMTHGGQLLSSWNMGGLAGSSTSGVVGHAMPNFHVGGAVILALRAMLFGQTLLTLTVDGFRNPNVVRNFWDIARKYKMTSLITTPATAAAILATPNTTSAGHCIESFNCGGSTISVELLRAFHTRFGIWLSEVWGMSELHGAVSGHLNDGREPVAGSVGRHFPWHPIKAIQVDADNNFLGECAPGERGVLAITGPGVTPGYVDSRLNAELFVKGMPGDYHWANTGDLGTVDENGHVWLFGRTKDVIIRGGHNIDPKMIEEVLVCHPAVQLAAAIGRPDPAKGEMPIAFVQLKAGFAATSTELIELCRQRVQERAAVPVEIIVIEQMPLTAVGKINKPTLRALTMHRVATQVADSLIANRGRFEVSIDEAGLRPCVKLRIELPEGDTQWMEVQIRDAFRNYEFLTVIEILSA